MKKKTSKVKSFLDGLHSCIVTDAQFRKKTNGKSETHIQTEIRPLIIRYLEKHFEKEGYKDFVAKANKSFYWEGQEGKYGKARSSSFGTRNYPDFIITEPYLIAFEYKKSPSGSTIKHGIGQSIMHTLCEEYDYVYFLFHDESDDKKICKSICNKLEKSVLEKMWQDFNVYMKFVEP
jgi:hypothetical protein